MLLHGAAAIGATVIMPDPDSLALEVLVADEGQVTIAIRARRATACCPSCGRPSARVQSWYRRVVADLLWQGVAVRLDLRTRRWFCDNAACAWRIFTARLPQVVGSHARRTVRLAAVVEANALALGGEGGVRILAAWPPLTEKSGDPR
jgi:transposase